MSPQPGAPLSSIPVAGFKAPTINAAAYSDVPVSTVTGLPLGTANLLFNPPTELRPWAPLRNGAQGRGGAGWHCCIRCGWSKDQLMRNLSPPAFHSALHRPQLPIRVDAGMLTL